MNGAWLALALLAGLTVAGHAAGSAGSANAPSTASAAFRRWFGDSKVVNSQGRPLRVCHGTRRADRIGGRFCKARATSGPMPYFTSDPEIASGYAMGKVDTSLDSPSDFAAWFAYKGKGMRSTAPLDRAWFFLSGTDRTRIAQNLPKVGYADAYAGEGSIVLGQGSIMDDHGVAYELRPRQRVSGRGRDLVVEWNPLR